MSGGELKVVPSYTTLNHFNEAVPARYSREEWNSTASPFTAEFAVSGLKFI